MPFIGLIRHRPDAIPANLASIQRAYLTLVGSAHTGIAVRYAIQFELPLVLSLDRDDMAIRPRPRIAWQISDRLAVRAGVDFYTGDEQDLLGRLQDNTLVFLGIKMSLR